MSPIERIEPQGRPDCLDCPPPPAQGREPQPWRLIVLRITSKLSRTVCGVRRAEMEEYLQKSIFVNYSWIGMVDSSAEARLTTNSIKNGPANGIIPAPGGVVAIGCGDYIGPDEGAIDTHTVGLLKQMTPCKVVNAIIMPFFIRPRWITT